MRWPTVDEVMYGAALVLTLAIAALDVLAGPWGS